MVRPAALGGARKSEQFREESKKFFVNYFKQIALVFGGAWNGRKYSIRSASALLRPYNPAQEVQVFGAEPANADDAARSSAS